MGEDTSGFCLACHATTRMDIASQSMPCQEASGMREVASSEVEGWVSPSLYPCYGLRMMD